MDDRWYNRRGENDDVFLVSRVRLLRNFDGMKFPDTMTDDERIGLIKKIDERFDSLPEVVGQRIQKVTMEHMNRMEKAALNERLLINKAAFLTERPYAVYASEDEAFSMTVNGTDHVRLLLSGRGQNLNGIFERLSSIDDYAGTRIPYAFDSKYGFKTANIANVGTGMRAYYVMHLPLLAEEKRFSLMTGEISRYGVNIHEALGDRKQKIGGLYVLYNQRTLGLQEKDILELLTGVANKLMEQERDLRKSHSTVTLKDRVMRSYGILKYSVRMDFPEACRHLSNIMLGLSLGFLKIDTDLGAYELVLGVMPGNLQVFYKCALDERNLLLKRAEYLQNFMQEITPV